MIFGHIILGEAIFGSPAGSGSIDPDGPIVNVIVHDQTGKITYSLKSLVRVVYEPSYVDVVSPERSWVTILK